MKLFVAISDVHISLKNLSVSVATLTQALNKARELKIPLFIAGDLNDGKAIMRSEWVKALIDLFEEFKDVKIYVLVGNHDLDNKNSSSNSLYFLKSLPNVVLIDSPMVIDFFGSKYGVIPYQPNNTEFLSELDKMKERADKLLIHQGILGAYMGDYVVDESSVNPDVFKDFKIVLSGHYHKAQKVPSSYPVDIYYFGSPFTVNFGESNENKFIYVIEELNGIPNLIYESTNVRRHVQVEWSKDKEEVKDIVEGSLLKIVLKGTKEYVREKDLEFFKKKFPQAASISIVPEIEKQSENRISAEIIHNPLKVVDEYLSMCNTTLDKVELKDFILNLCSEIFQSNSNSSSKNFKITSIEAKNFLSFKDMKYSYSPMGLTLVEGYDEDLGVNTGAGKSTLLDAPVYGLFGETSKNLKSDEVINRLEGKNLCLITTLQGEDGEYKIFRYRKHSQFENDLYMLLPNGQELRGKDNRETQKMIEQTIGCSFDVFLKSTYFTQFGNIDRFLSASDTEKKKLISEITDLSIYDDMLDLIKKFISSLDVSIQKEQKSYDTLKSNIELIESMIEKKKVELDDWNSGHHNSIMELNNKSNNFKNELKASISELITKRNSWEEFNKGRIDQVKSLSSKFLDDEITRKKDLEYQNHILNGDIEEIKFKIDELKKVNSENFEESKKDINNKLDIIRKLEDNLIRQKSSRDFKNSELISVKKKISSEYEKKENNLNTECSFCHQEVSPDHIDKHIEELNQVASGINSELEAINSTIDNINKQVSIKSTLNQSLKDIEAKERAQIDIKYKIDSFERNIKDIEKQIERNNIEMKKDNINPHELMLQQVLEEVNPFISQIDNEMKKKNHFIEMIESKKLEQNPHISGLKELEDQNIEKMKELNTLSIRLSELNKKDQLASWWKQAIHVYIKSYLMDSCLESINTIANEYLNTLFEGVLKFDISSTTEKGSEIKEKINISIINNGDECSYQSLSGGERCRICLAVNLALAEVISKSNGKSFNFIQLDEIFNGLDEAGKSQSMKLLKELERKYETIFVIDHADGFKTLFTNSVVVKKKDKVSYIV